MSASLAQNAKRADAQQAHITTPETPIDTSKPPLRTGDGASVDPCPIRARSSGLWRSRRVASGHRWSALHQRSYGKTQVSDLDSFALTRRRSGVRDPQRPLVNAQVRAPDTAPGAGRARQLWEGVPHACPKSQSSAPFQWSQWRARQRPVSVFAKPRPSPGVLGSTTRAQGAGSGLVRWFDKQELESGGRKYPYRTEYRCKTCTQEVDAVFASYLVRMIWGSDFPGLRSSCGERAEAVRTSHTP